MFFNKLIVLNFDDIKLLIRSYFKIRDEFVDYDFEGLGLLYFIDMLVYNIYYMVYFVNMLMNEVFL